MDRLREVLKKKLYELNLTMESAASEEAQRLGLDYMSFGRWGKDGKVTHKTKGDKLVQLSKKASEKITTQEPSDPNQMIGGNSKVNPAPDATVDALKVGDNHYHVKKKDAGRQLPGTIKALMTQYPNRRVSVNPTEDGFDIYLQQKTADTPASMTIDVGNMSINPKEKIVTVDNNPIKLSKSESKVLMHLAANKGKPVDSKTLLTKVFGYAPDVQSRAADITMSRLKKKLGPAGSMIRTVRGVGYRLDD